jgi:hypothetical protein
MRLTQSGNQAIGRNACSRCRPLILHTQLMGADRAVYTLLAAEFIQVAGALLRFLACIHHLLRAEVPFEDSTRSDKSI